MSAAPLLSELDRQQKYLDKLPKSFSFPLFNSRKALESQRHSGYRNTAAAAREIIDNAIEAQSTRVHVVFETPTDTRRPGQRKKSISSVAFIDNGSGMLPAMVRYALSWGGGTHFDDPQFIGKFGFGLPNASINQTQCVEVYTKTDRSPRIHKAWLDINDYDGEGTTQQISAPTESKLPTFVQAYLDRNDWKFDHGTVVVWKNPDRLSYRTPAMLREHLLDDFGATYRYLLRNFELQVDGTTVAPLDPMFIDPEGRFFRPESEGGAKLQHDESLEVCLVVDRETGERHVVRESDLEEGQEVVTQGSINVRVARFPLGFVVGAKGDAGIEPVDEHAKQRFEIRKSRRGISFVRAGREIETVDAFPRRASDRAGGLGEWPLLQSYAYHYGLELAFGPQLDALFGITNDKQQVRPLEDVWRLLAQEQIDELLTREDKWQRNERSKAAKSARAAKSTNEKSDEASPAARAAAAADVAEGADPSVPEREHERARQNFDRATKENSERDGSSESASSEKLETRHKRQRYEIGFFDEERGPFFLPEWVGKQIVVRINRKHEFFSVLYDSLLSLPGGALAKESVDVMLFALARGELRTKNEETADFYRAQRERHWTQFLGVALRALQRGFPSSEEELGLE